MTQILHGVGTYRVIDGARVKVRRGCGDQTEVIDAIDSEPLHLQGVAYLGGSSALEETRRGRISLVPLTEEEEGAGRIIEALAAVRILPTGTQTQTHTQSGSDAWLTRLLVNTTPHRKTKKLGWVTLNLKSLKKISELEAGLSPTSAAAEMTAGTTDQEHYDADGAGTSPPFINLAFACGCSWSVSEPPSFVIARQPWLWLLRRVRRLLRVSSGRAVRAVGGSSLSVGRAG